MDIGLHILGSVTSNENGLTGQKELQGSKQDRSGFNGEDCLQRNSKLARTITTTAEAEVEVEEEEECFSSSSAYCNKTMSFHQGIPLTRSASLLSSDSRRQEHMLSFSDKPEALDFSRYVGLDNTSSNKNSFLSPFLASPSCFKSSGGYGSDGMMMNMSMQGNFTSVKGPFTLTQWAELEQQALIYKYITANVPVPSSLLISIKKSFYSYGSLPPTSFGWGAFHLGLAGGNMDPEPGRCRRTDGKKWRCSRDAVPDQKYCERHINRGRHRSRKHVEVQSSQTAAAISSKAVTTLQQQSAVAGGSNRSNARASSNRPLATGGQCINPSTDSIPNNRVRNPQGVNLQPKESPLVAHQKHRTNNNPFEFGHISSESLLNPNTVKSYGSSFLDFSSNQDKHSGNHNHDSWPEELKSDWTQLSMSIPISSSSTSPSTTHNTAQDKVLLSPLRLSREIDQPFQTEETLEAAKKANTWIPISWGNSLGGPLGEVLNSTTNSPTLGSSPTGVLQKSTFCSLSNSSSVSSPPIAIDNNNNNNRNNVDYFHHYTT